MFHLDLPNVYKVISKSEFKLDETFIRSESSEKSSEDGGGNGDTGEEPKGGGDTAKEQPKRKKDVWSKQIIVVSVFGSSFYRAVPSKERARFKRAFQLSLDAFGTVKMFQDEDETRESTDEGGGKGTERNLTSQQMKTAGTLEGFLNEDESVLFLHIDGFAYDATSCLEACQELHSSIKDSGFLSVWSSFNTSYCKWLLLLFSLSHVMILSEIGGSFDTSYISLFRALDIVRLDVLSSVSKILSTIDGLPRQWVDHARLCSPRLLFLFEVESLNPTKFNHTGLSTSMPGRSDDQQPSLQERRGILQSEIYHIFRKCRIITNITANSLFALPLASTEVFVYIFDKSAQNALPSGSKSGHSLSYTYLDFINTSGSLRKSQKINCPVRPSTSATSVPMKTHFRSSQDTLTYPDVVNSFRTFLSHHFSLALDRGFDDDYRRVSESKHFFVRPTLQQWESAYKKLHCFLILEPSGSKRITDAYLQMERFINVNSEYLEMQCSELFPKVFAAYQRSPPSEFYTAHQHQQKLTYAYNLFLNIGQGPEVRRWMNKLIQKCDKYWKNGRQQCETLSLLGHVCSQPVHKIKRKDHLEIVPLPEQVDQELPELSHSSSSKLTSYCNCGRRQASRDEPFTIRQANYDYYRKAGRDCCDKLESHSFPVFTPLHDDDSALGESQQLSLQEMIVILQRKSDSLISLKGDVSTVKTTQKEKADQNGVGLDEEEVFEAELRQEESDEDEELEEEEEAIEEQDEIEETSGKRSLSKDNVHSDRTLFKRHSSTVEYLPGMYHSKSPLGLLPLFPSWSLVCLGPSSIYSHSHGCSQHGFLHSANALLPWDVKVKAEKGVLYVPPTRTSRDRRFRQPRPRREILVSSHLPPSTTTTTSASTVEEFSVKVFFGFEYECRKGHRFFCDSHEKVLYALNISQVTQKTIAGKVIGSDMPLYVHCPCKENRDLKQVAQLMRVHIVTPKAPVFVTVAPRLQPGPGAPIFTPSPSIDDSESPESIKLSPSSYWILRLPFSYVGEVVYVPPNDILKYNGKLFKGLLNVVSMSAQETEEWEKLNQNRL